MCGKILAILVMTAVLGGCSVGPIRQMTAGGVNTSNSVMPAVNMIDETGTMTGEATNTASAERIDADGVWGTDVGTGRRRFVYSTGGTAEDGSALGTQFVLSAADDVSADRVAYNPRTGLIEIDGFQSGVSEPTRASNEALDRYREIWDSLTEDQRQVLQTYAAEIGDAIPTVADVVMKLLVPMP